MRSRIFPQRSLEPKVQPQWRTLLDSQNGSPWLKVLKTLVVYRMLDPGSEWQEVKDDVHVKLLPRKGELYVLARSLPRRSKESAMRREKLKSY